MNFYRYIWDISKNDESKNKINHNHRKLKNKTNKIHRRKRRSHLNNIYKLRSTIDDIKQTWTNNFGKSLRSSYLLIQFFLAIGFNFPVISFDKIFHTILIVCTLVMINVISPLIRLRSSYIRRYKNILSIKR